MGHWASRRHRRQHVTDSDEDVTLRWRTGWVVMMAGAVFAVGVLALISPTSPPAAQATPQRLEDGEEGRTWPPSHVWPEMVSGAGGWRGWGLPSEQGVPGLTLSPPPHSSCSSSPDAARPAEPGPDLLLPPRAVNSEAAWGHFCPLCPHQHPALQDAAVSAVSPRHRQGRGGWWHFVPSP